MNEKVLTLKNPLNHYNGYVYVRHSEEDKEKVSYVHSSPSSLRIILVYCYLWKLSQSDQLPVTKINTLQRRFKENVPDSIETKIALPALSLCPDL
ncbi:hypothetical protein TNCV_4431191 [Trichonephila clavipes]|nr:hypothetical protein TNCV_4431191 [Trichonephila clavipes]